MRPWERLPDRQVAAVLRVWSRVPRPVQRALAPIGRLVNPGSVASVPAGPGPNVVPGVTALVAAGWVPLETLTGMLRVGEVWPVTHRRSVPETRPAWLEDQWLGSSHGLVWLVRSPWPAMPAQEALGRVWLHIERDAGRTADLTEDQLLDEAGEVLNLSEAEVRSLS